MKSICLINVWIGPLPDNFPLFLRTVQFNPTVDFYFVTDQDYKCELTNVHFIKMTLSEIKEKFEAEVGMRIKLKYAYKLCDYKPLWRVLIPREVFERYEFWGHCDLDILLGDIRSFITDDLLEQYDRVLDCGHLCFLKNETNINELYRRSLEKDNMAYPYKRAFRTNYACYFDEYMGMSILFWKYYKSFYDQTSENMVQDFGWQHYNFESYIDNKSFIFKWKQGKLYKFFVDKNGCIIQGQSEPKEYVELHVQKRKMQILFNLDACAYLDEFWIYPNAYDLHCPDYPLYDDNKLREYEEYIAKRDKAKRIENLKKYGIIDYIPHFFISRKIKKFIREEKKFF